jgi:hypothetical protein
MELLLGTLYVLKVALPPLLSSTALGALRDDDQVGVIEPSAFRRDLALTLEPPRVLFEDRVMPQGLLDALDKGLSSLLWDDMVLPRFAWADFDMDMPLTAEPFKFKRDIMASDGLFFWGSLSHLAFLPLFP